VKKELILLMIWDPQRPDTFPSPTSFFNEKHYDSQTSRQQSNIRGSQFSPNCAVLSIKAVAAFLHFQISERAGKCHSAYRVLQLAATKALLHDNL